jgi:hypothetical protein
MFVLWNRTIGLYYKSPSVMVDDINDATIFNYPINIGRDYGLYYERVDVKIIPIKKYWITFDETLYYVGDGTWTIYPSLAKVYDLDEANEVMETFSRVFKKRSSTKVVDIANGPTYVR